jgi:hypothetical protein
MNIAMRFKAIALFRMTLCFVFPMTVVAQTFSPYTPKQIEEFNNQPIAPVETPAGPVYLESPPVSQKPNISINSRYIKNPDGEEQAEAQGAESAVPFEPIPSTFTF